MVYSILNYFLIRIVSLPHLVWKYKYEFHGYSFRLEPLPLCSRCLTFNWTTHVWPTQSWLFGWEYECTTSITLHAPACLLCLISGVVSPVAVMAAWAHPFVRFLYIGAYVADIPPA